MCNMFSRGEEKRGLEVYLKKLWLKTSQTQRTKQIPDIGSTEDPKQYESKQTYTKTY